MVENVDSKTFIDGLHDPPIRMEVSALGVKLVGTAQTPPSLEKLDQLLADAKAAFDRLTPAQQREMREEQRQNWVRAELAMKD